MKHPTKLLAALTFLTAGTTHAYNVLQYPTTNIEVGKTYVLQHTNTIEGASYNYDFLCDINEFKNQLRCVQTFSKNCLWIAEQGADEASIELRNFETKGYLFTVGSDHDAITSDEPVHLKIRDSSTVGISQYYPGSIFLSTDSIINGECIFIGSYTNNGGAYIYCGDNFNEWYAYELSINKDLPLEPIEVNVGKVRYEITCPQYIQEAIAIGISSDNFDLDGLEIADFVSINGFDYPVTSIADGAFKGLVGFKGKLKLGKNLKSIGARAFSGCSRLSGSLDIPVGVINLEDVAEPHVYNL